jgi:ketosteroid isomerase-like protein
MRSCTLQVKINKTNSTAECSSALLKPMKKVLVFTVAMLLTLAVQAQTVATTDPTQDPKAVTMAFFKVLKDADSGTLVKIATDDFVIISSDGQQAERDLLVQGLSGGFLTVQESPINVTRTSVYNSDASIVSGSTRFKGDLQGQKFDTAIIFSATCIKQGAGWKIAGMQITPEK